MHLEIVEVGPLSGPVAFSAGHDCHSAPNLHLHYAFSCHIACQACLTFNLFNNWCCLTGYHFALGSRLLSGVPARMWPGLSSGAFCGASLSGTVQVRLVAAEPRMLVRGSAGADCTGDPGLLI